MRLSFSGNRIVFISIALVAITVAAFWPVVHHDFVVIDDTDYVTENNVVKDGLTTKGLAWAFTSFYAANWHPLTWVSHMIDVEIFGIDPGGHHFINLIFHLLSTILLFIVLRAMTGSCWPSAVVAALFGIHPLHVESVAWVAERKDVLSTFFWMLTMGAYLWYARNPRLTRYLTVVLTFTLGLMAKPMLVTLPFVLLLLDYWPLGRLNWGQRRSVEISRNGVMETSLRHLVLEKVPLFVLTAAASVITYQAQGGYLAIAAGEAYPLPSRVSNALVVYAKYMWMAVWPEKMAAFYPLQGRVQWWLIVLSVAVLLALFLFSFRERKQRPYFAVGWLWYFGTLVPVIGLVQVGSQAMADRYTYVPLIGLFIVAVWGVSELLGKITHRKKLAGGLAALVLGALFVITRSQVGIWQNSITLFNHALEVTSDNWEAHGNLGYALQLEGRNDEAIWHYKQALEIKPGYTIAKSNLGTLLAIQGRSDRGGSYIKEAMRRDPKLRARAHLKMGDYHAQEGRYAQAAAEYRKALQIFPNLATAKAALETVLQKLEEAEAGSGGR